jgi:flavodoxin
MVHILVAYFSASGITKQVGDRLAIGIGADIFEIKPEVPYSDADLRWTNPLARCNREKIGHKDVSIAKRVKNMDKYDTLYIGFPIWYYGAPNIIESFLKSYDLSGKKIALFATSGGSDMGKTVEKLKPFISKDAEIIGAKLFYENTGMKELIDWSDSLSI